MSAPTSAETFLVLEGKKISIENDAESPNAAMFKFSKEDQTIGNVLKHQLLKDKNVIYVGYPNPLEHNFLLRIQTDGGNTPADALLTALTALRAKRKRIAPFADEDVSAKRQKSAGNENGGIEKTKPETSQPEASIDAAADMIERMDVSEQAEETPAQQQPQPEASEPAAAASAEVGAVAEKGAAPGDNFLKDLLNMGRLADEEVQLMFIDDDSDDSVNADDDPDSNDENDFRNDYPDEGEFDLNETTDEDDDYDHYGDQEEDFEDYLEEHN